MNSRKSRTGKAQSPKPAPSKETPAEAQQRSELEKYWQLMRQLPFHRQGDYKKKIERSWWALPARGGYEGGCEAGTNAATAFLKFLREAGKLGGDNSGGRL